MPRPDDGMVDLSEIARTKVPEPVIDANTRNERDRFAHVEKMQGVQLARISHRDAIRAVPI